MRKLRPPFALLLLAFAFAFASRNAAAAQSQFALLHSLFDPSTNTQAGAWHGLRVAIDGNLVAVSSLHNRLTGNSSGVVTVYDRSNGMVLHSLTNPSPADYDYFGISLAIQGSRLVVGAYETDTGAINAGVVYVYELMSATPLVPSITLTNPEPAAYENFGRAVGISRARVVIGAPQENTGATRAGSAYIYDLASATPAVPAITLHNPNPGIDDYFGVSVAISDSRVAVGALFDDTGADNAGTVYVYDLSRPIPSVPIHTLHNPNPRINDYFGSAVAISGTRLVIGAFGNSDPRMPAGSAYLYDLTLSNLALPIVTLTRPSQGDRFGVSVAISGLRIIVGADEDSTGAQDSGSAYVYDVTSSAPHIPVLSLTNPAPGFYDHFGTSVAISGSGIIVGAYYDDTFGTESGTAYVYDLAGATPALPVDTLPSSVPATGDAFGGAVAISGNLMVVGALWDASGEMDAGRAYVYSLTNAELYWPVLWLTNPAPTDRGYFGTTVAISGMRAVVGMPGISFGPGIVGRAYVYDLTNATPARPAVTLRAPSNWWFEHFGSSVAISGTRVVVGAPGNSNSPAGVYLPGWAYVYDMASTSPNAPVTTLTNPTPAHVDRFGISVAISGTRVVIGADRDNTGAPNSGGAYVYDLSRAQPGVPVLTLINPSPALEDNFASAVAISGTRVVIGSPGDDTGATDSGIVYVYDLAAATPATPLITLTNPSPAQSDLFGKAVAVSGARIVVGVSQDDSHALDTGIAYVYDLSSGTPAVPEALVNPGSAEFDYFGHAVAIDGTTAMVGAPLNDTGGESRGAAYVFGLRPTVNFIGFAPGLAILSWTPAHSPGFVLQYADSLSPPNWLPAPSGARNPVTIATTNAARFYRVALP